MSNFFTLTGGNMSDKIRVFDMRKDEKVQAKCLLIDMSIQQYIKLIENNLENLDIQRGKILSRKKRVYNQLIKDLKENTIMPPISLVIIEESNLTEKIKNIEDLKEIE